MRRPFLEIGMSKNGKPLWRKERFQVKMYKRHQHRTIFGSGRPKIARRCGPKRIFKSKCTKHTMLGPLWKLGCRKMAHRCGVKRISKSKCYEGPRPLLKVRIFKNCTPLRREAHVQVKMYKTNHFRNTFGGSDAEKCTR